MTEGVVRTRETNTLINRDYIIPHLARLLEVENRDINLLVWNTVRKADPEVLEAAYRPNQTYTPRTQKSSLVLKLADTKWIPDKMGRLRQPRELTMDRLHRDFKYDNRNGWLDEIGFGENSKKESEEYKSRKDKASSLGVPVELVDLVTKLPEEERESQWKEIINDFKRKQTERKRGVQQQGVPYHESLAGAFSNPGKSTPHDREGSGGASRNPARRRGKISEDIAAAIENEGKPGSRFSFALRKKWRGKKDRVRAAFTEWYGGRCQICGETFTQRSGEPYFEGLYLVPYTTAEWLDRVGNVLCLCPLHSAMFQFGPKELDEDIVQQVLHQKVRAEGGDRDPSIRMKLCENIIYIKFAESHLIDLQEMIKVAHESEHKQGGPREAKDQ